MASLDYRQLVRQALDEITEVAPADLDANFGKVQLLIDVREPDEVEQGAIPGAVHIPRGMLESAMSTTRPPQDTEIVLYCAGGARSALAAKTLQDMGYSNVASLNGGFERWKREGLHWGILDTLTAEQRTRYDRHLKLPEVGEEGQTRLLESRVLVIGAGGLGSPAALYLAAAGVGTLGIVDGDSVDLTNLQRQVLHNAGRVGRGKVESAQETLMELNPDVSIQPHPVRLEASNALQIMAGYDVIVDGADNFPTRYLVNDASVYLRIPVVHGSIFRFEGQASVFAPYRGPCYRCLFPAPPPPELAPSCAEAGVLGALPGIIGSIQAVETLKLLLDVGDPLIGRLLTYDALEERFSTLVIERDPTCLACGDEEKPPVLVDYDDACTPVGVSH